MPGWERLRDRARELKQEVIEHLDFYLEQFADKVERNGGKVHWAETADEACRIVLEIAQQCGAREIVKAKSMVGEEVELNHAFEARGIHPVRDRPGRVHYPTRRQPARAHRGPRHSLDPA